MFDEAHLHFSGRLIGQSRNDHSFSDGFGPFAAVLTDRLGSVVRNAEGQNLRFYPFGDERTSSTAGPLKFGTYARDASGLDYANQRYHGPGFGRFMTADPSMPGTVDNPASWNLYSYVQGDPANFNDPQGLLLSWIFGGGAGPDLPGPGVFAFAPTAGLAFFLPTHYTGSVFFRPFLQELPFIEGWRSTDTRSAQGLTQIEVLVDQGLYRELVASGFMVGSIARSIEQNCPLNFPACRVTRILVGVTVSVPLLYDCFIKWKGNRQPQLGRPRNTPPGTKPIDQAGLPSREAVHDVRSRSRGSRLGRNCSRWFSHNERPSGQGDQSWTLGRLHPSSLIWIRSRSASRYEFVIQHMTWRWLQQSWVYNHRSFGKLATAGSRQPERYWRVSTDIHTGFIGSTYRKSNKSMKWCART